MAGVDMGSCSADSSKKIPKNPAFEYSALKPGDDSFRLLRILPQLTDKLSIKCELINAFISRQAGDYVAVSYVSESSEPTKLMLVNGAAFVVRQNLFIFLRKCRHRTKALVVWVDAVCINQCDNEERRTQARAMKQIYSGARSVYCWLGDQDVWSFINLFERSVFDQVKSMAAGSTKQIPF